MPILERYLKANIDNQVKIKSFDNINEIPIFLRNIYNFYEMIIIGMPCLLLEIIGEAPGIDLIEKHIKRIEDLTNLMIVIYYKDISRYRRKSLIENRIPFVIEDGQMFLPFLGLNLKRTSQKNNEERKTFSISSQLAFLYFLYNKNEVVNTTELASRLGFTIMTASRALNELLDARLISYEIGGKTGRSKTYRRIQDPDYFRIGNSYIKSPVKKVVYVKTPPENALTAGLEALAELSMLNPSSHMVRAISQDELINQELKIIEDKDILKDEIFVELEIWHFNPNHFVNKKYVDIMSLYASLKDEKDERIQQALDEVLRSETWYTD